jgi:two-component system, cell cycle response regulator DivK
MNSRFYYPTNTGSLGEPRRVHNFMSLIEQRSSWFGADYSRGQNHSSFGKPTVLVVEDEDNCLFALRDILSTKGYLVLEAWDGKQAIEVAEAENLDLILLDLQLPRLNGLSVIHRLRENMNLENLPIVIMTGHEPEKYQGSAIAAGCDDFLLKPIDLDRLDAVLEYFVPLRTAS